jgi:hypothetical protein
MLFECPAGEFVTKIWQRRTARGYFTCSKDRLNIFIGEKEGAQHCDYVGTVRMECSGGKAAGEVDAQADNTNKSWNSSVASAQGGARCSVADDAGSKFHLSIGSEAPLGRGRMLLDAVAAVAAATSPLQVLPASILGLVNSWTSTSRDPPHCAAHKAP